MWILLNILKRSCISVESRKDSLLTRVVERYVLKNKDTGDVLFVVVFTLLHKDEMDQEEVQKAEKTQQAAEAKADQAKMEGESSKEGGFVGGGDDDVD